MEGFEPSTPALRKPCSTVELHRRIKINIIAKRLAFSSPICNIRHFFRGEAVTQKGMGIGNIAVLGVGFGVEAALKPYPHRNT